jgi:hypothetical protein
MLKCLGVLTILTIVTSGCGANRAPTAGPSVNADSTTPPRPAPSTAAYNPCEHAVYRRLTQGLLSRPAGIDDRDRKYLFELDRLCREHSNSAAAGPAKGPPPQQVLEVNVPACTHPVYTSLREGVYANPGRLTDEDHWYFHELDRACLQGKIAAAEKDLVAAAEIQLKNKSNRNPYQWLAFVAGLGGLAWNLLLSAP